MKKITSKSAIAALLLTMGFGVAGPANASEPFIGQIQYFGFNFAPRGWALCQGQLLPISSNSALFSLLGTIYGGDGRTSFALPDMRGRVAMGMGRGPGLSERKIGSRGGAETTTLTVNNLPNHSHSATLHANSGEGDASAPASNTVLAAGDSRNKVYSTSAPDVQMAASSITLTNTGGSQAFNNMQPYLTVNCSIALVGLFPSRS